MVYRPNLNHIPFYFFNSQQGIRYLFFKRGLLVITYLLPAGPVIW